MAKLIKEARESRDFGAGEMRDLEEEMRHFAERREERNLLVGNEDDEGRGAEKRVKTNMKGKKKKKMDEDGNVHDQLTGDQAKIGKTGGE